MPLSAFPNLGVLTGLVAEARLAAGLGQVMTGGGDRAGAVRAAEKLVRSGVSAVLSFGLAGGLSPGLKPGALVVPAAVLVDGERIGCDPRLLAWLGGATVDLLTDAPAIIVSRSAKSAMWAASGAAAVDLESGPLALAAARAGIGFAVLRAVCDPADRDLPPAALAALDSNGAIGGLRIAQSILRHPSQLPTLIALGRDASRARRTLVAVTSGTGAP